jgi:hypothetical protein
MEERLSQAQLTQRVAAAKAKIKVGARYMHYKQLSYIVVTIALLEATNEPCVVYQAEYDTHITFVRPVASWIEQVEWQGKVVPRFAEIMPSAPAA